MALIKVKLRIVGIYFNRTIEFEAGDQPTIKTLLEAARTQFPLGSKDGFDYEATVGGGRSTSILTFTHNFSGLYDYNGDGSINPGEGKTLSGGYRAPGLYKLREQSIESGVLGWQSYVIRAGQLISKTPVAGGFVYFSDQKIQNDDEVIWRLVAIGTKAGAPPVQPLT